MKIRGVQDYSEVGAVKVYVDGIPLGHKASCKVVNHSPSGFQWGYAGSGPAQLALAVLLLRTPNDAAEILHQRFKNEYIVPLPKDEDFEIEVNVDEWIVEHGYSVENRMIGLGEVDTDEFGKCSFPERCQRAEWKNCDCSCGGKNHGIQASMFGRSN